MRFRSALSLCLGLVISFFLVGCGGSSSSSGGGGGTPTLSSISVSPSSASLSVNGTQQFTATGHYSDSSTKDLTNSATWSSSNSGVASVTSGGLATGVAAGTSTITATSGSKSGTATVTVAAANLTSITVSPATASIEAGATQQFTATGHYDDSSTRDLTSSVTWSSSSTSLATINSAGLATGVASGSVTITATSGSVSSTAALTVTAVPRTLTSITVSPATASVVQGLTTNFTATGHYSDNSTQDLTASVTWTSSATGVATVAAGVATGVSAGTANIVATSGSISGTAALTVTAPTLSTISVSPATATVSAGGTQQFTATGHYNNNTTQDLTSSVSWTSSDTSKATISVTGLATTLASGSVTITATSGAISGNAALTITSATLQSITISPASASIAKGLTQQFTATGHYSDSTTQNLTSTVTWTSSSTSVATVAAGLATGVAVGGTTITATSGSISGTASLTVTAAALQSITLSPTSASIAKGLTQQFTATGHYSDSSTQNLTSSATWTSNSNSIATVAAGLATGVAAGSTTITAASGSVSGSATLTVTAPVLTSIDVTPANPTITNTGTQQFTATGHYSDSTTADLTSSVTWSSSSTAAATIASTGLATGVSAGNTTITATSGVVSGSTILYVTSLGAYVQGAVGDSGGATSQTTTTTNPVVTGNLILVFAHWDSASPIATVAISDSSLNSYTAVFANPIKTNTTHYFQVWYAKNITGGSQLQVKISFSSSTANYSTLDVMEYSGLDKVTPIDGTISATGTGTTESSGNITVPNPNSEIVVGMFGYPSSGANPYSAGSGFTARPANTSGTTFVEDEAALNAGTYAATATSGNSSTWAAIAVGLRYAGAAGSATLQSIAVTPATATIASGTAQQYTATGTYSDNSTQNLTNSVTWASSDPSKATISGAGLATGVAAGTVTIQATSGSVSGTASLTVQAPTLQSVTVSPSSSQLSANSTLQLTATAHYSDSTTQDVTNTATWSTGSSAVATVDSTGLVTGVGAGTTNIQATYNSTSGTSSITVTPSGLTAWWRFNEASGTQAADSSGNSYNATFNHGITWTSGQTGGAISANGTNQYMSSTAINLSSTSALTLAGWVAHVWTGTTKTVFAELGTDYSTVTDGFVAYIDDSADCSTAGSIFIIVRGNVGNSSKCFAPPSSNGWHHIAIVLDKSQPGNSEVSLYIDGALQSSSSSPNSSNNTNAFGTESLYLFSQGGASLFGKAMVSDMRLYNRALTSTEVTQLHTLGATSGTLQSIALSPQNSSVIAGNAVQFDALGTYSDASVRDVSTEATWASSSTSAATIDATGLATGVASGSTTISATDGAVNQSTGLTVNPASGTGGYAVQNTKGDSGAATSESTGFNTPVTAGHTFVVFSHWGDQSITVTSLTDTLGNTFTPIAGPINFGTNQRAQMWYAKITNGGTEDHFTITYSGTTTQFSLLDVVEYAGLDATTPFSGVYSTAIGTGTALDSGAVNVAAANTKTLIGVFGTDSNAGYPFTVASGFTEDLPNEVTSDYESMPIATTGNVNATGTAANSVNWVSFGLLFNNN